MKKNKKMLVMAGATILLVLAMAAGYQIGLAMHTWFVSCGIWLIAAGLWLSVMSRYSKRQNSAEQRVSLLDDKAQPVIEQVKKAKPKVFKKQMRELGVQTERLNKKTEQLDQALQDYFGDSRISYQKFAATIAGVIDVFSERTQKLLKRIEVFDEDGYEQLFKTHQEYTDAMIPYRKTFEEIDQDLSENEKILEQMDRLLREVNQLDDSKNDLSELPAMQELDELIDQTKIYKQNVQSQG